MRLGHYFLVIVALFVFSASLTAQTYTVTGEVTATQTGEKLIGANVYLKGTTMGDASDENGKFNIVAPQGKYTLVCSYIGYETKEVEINLNEDTNVDFSLREFQFSLNVTVLSDRAKERETPVAFTNVDKEQIRQQLGSRDIPLVLNTTPSVYATTGGGGSGDARINVRGFDQRNVAIMINGIPINDMENGWVYWSNWDGLGDFTTSLQLQRGLSAINLATPSIGGVLNVITDPTQHKLGGLFKQELGSDGFFKSTLGFNSGMIGDNFAFSGGVVRKLGDGTVDKTWTDAWAYYFGASYQVNDDNRLEIYGLGAPQRHGQNLYKQNIAAYSHDFAKDLDDYDQAALNDYPESPSGLLYNENWGPVRSSYTGQQYWDGSTHDRYDPDFINERENYYSKPLANINWYSKLTDIFSLYTTVYYSGGTGGGTGTLGSIKWDYTGPSRTADWNATLDNNMVSDTAKGILRNSTNNQWTIGAISRGFLKVSKNLTLQAGVDWRTAEIEHYREVRDLLGGKFYYWNGDEFNPNKTQYKLGDKLDYNFTNTVDWLGFFGQGEYTTKKVSIYGMFGYSMIKYGYTNHFVKGPDGGELTAETDNITGYQVKGGASYRFTPNVSIFGNAGYVSKVPIFDQVISDRDGTTADDPDNEKFTSFEAGVDLRLFKGKMHSKLNFYYTNWIDRANSIGVTLPSGEEGFVFISGLDTRHMGVEFETAIQPHRIVRFDLSASIGDWVHTDDVAATYKDYASGGANDVNYNLYIKDLKVGDAPQTQLSLVTSLMPVEGLVAQIVWMWNGSHYAAWDAFDRDDPTDRTQSWEIPSHNRFDFHFTYDLPFDLNGFGFQLFGHIFNALDTEYILEAVDNSPYNGFDGDHDADDAEVFFGLPRTFNVGISIAR